MSNKQAKKENKDVILFVILGIAITVIFFYLFHYVVDAGIYVSIIAPFGAYLTTCVLTYCWIAVKDRKNC